MSSGVVITRASNPQRVKRRASAAMREHHRVDAPQPGTARRDEQENKA
jgi:hypothetical protein